jgi:periplasmic protein TonB
VARAAGDESEVLVQFVVDTAGRADMASVRILRANYREFVEAVLKVLPEYRFQPATVNGCPARMYVQLPFAFAIRR